MLRRFTHTLETTTPTLQQPITTSASYSVISGTFYGLPVDITLEKQTLHLPDIDSPISNSTPVGDIAVLTPAYS